MNNLLECPVCGKKYLKQGLKNHIINSAEGEAIKQMKGFFGSKGTQHCFSKLVVLRSNPHFSFLIKNSKIDTKKKLSL